MLKNPVCVCRRALRMCKRALHVYKRCVKEHYICTNGPHVCTKSPVHVQKSSMSDISLLQHARMDMRNRLRLMVEIDRNSPICLEKSPVRVQKKPHECT